MPFAFPFKLGHAAAYLVAAGVVAGDILEQARPRIE
jgi:hypothetical protein